MWQAAAPGRRRRRAGRGGEERKVVLKLRKRLALPFRANPRTKRAHAHVLQLVPRAGGDGEVRAGAGGTSSRRVVDDHGHAVRRAVHVALHPVYVALEREAERRHRVFGAVLRLASVRHDVRHGDIRQRRRRRHAESGRDKRALHECCHAEARCHTFCLHFYPFMT